MAAFCHENRERSGLQRKGLEQMQNKRQDGDTVRSEGAQSNFSQSWPLFFMSEAISRLSLFLLIDSPFPFR